MLTPTPLDHVFMMLFFLDRGSSCEEMAFMFKLKSQFTGNINTLQKYKNTVQITCKINW